MNRGNVGVQRPDDVKDVKAVTTHIDVGWRQSTHYAKSVICHADDDGDGAQGVALVWSSLLKVE